MMNCKNCKTDVVDVNFCSNCGAEVVTEKLTVKRFWKQFTSQFLGWDNKFMKTVKGMLRQPEVVLTSYIDGTRKKYVPPMLFVALGITLVMLMFNVFQEKYMELNRVIVNKQSKMVDINFESEETNKQYEDYEVDSMEFNQKFQKFLVKYFNLISLIFLPFFSLLSFWIYRRKHSFAEHLVFNCYIQGLSFLFTIVFFLLAITISPKIYPFATLLTVFLYLYTFKRLYKQNFKQILIAILKFIGLLTAACLIFSIIIGVIVAVFVILTKKT